jgi:hypothetical protein
LLLCESTDCVIHFFSIIVTRELVLKANLSTVCYV